MPARKRPAERRQGATLVRMSEAEEALLRKVAGREPLASFCRRILVEYCERRVRAERGKA